jgi:acetoin utilization protein AcuB
MVTNPVTISPEQTLGEARRLFENHKIRRLPVVVDNILVGILSPGDLEKAMPSIFDSEGSNEEEYLADHVEIRTVMTSSPLTIKADEPLIEAAYKMRKNKIDGLPVVEDGSLVGVISITDILDAFIEILSTNQPGTRLDLKIDRQPESFYKMIKIFQRQQKEVLAITQHHDFSKTHQLITIQIRGHDNDDLLEQLWDNKVMVEKVTQLP